MNVYWSNSNSPFSLQVVVVFSAELIDFDEVPDNSNKRPTIASSLQVVVVFSAEFTDFDEVPDNSNKRPTYTVSSDSMQEKTRLQF